MIFVGKNLKTNKMAPLKKFKNFLNCHNFGCVQDRVVIFVFRIWFSKAA